MYKKKILEKLENTKLTKNSADYYWGYSIFHYFGDYSILVPDPDEWLFDLTLFWIICL